MNEFESKMNIIIAAIKERGYNPYNQLLGYITENNPSYITSKNNARELIQTLDFKMVEQYVKNMKG